MPEFILNRPIRRVHPFYALDDFAKGYVEAMFFTNGDTGDEREGLLNELGVERLTRAAVESIAADCRAFLNHIMPDGCFAQQWLDRAEGYDAEQAGRDFWFTRQGHGVGFWDRKELKVDMWTPDAPTPGLGGGVILPEDDTAEGYTFVGTLGAELSNAAQAQGKVYPFVNRGWVFHGC